MTNENDRLLVVAKLIVNDMDAVASQKVGNELFMGMGIALARVYSILRGIPPSIVQSMKPIDMMKWIREEPLYNSQKLIIPTPKEN